MIIHDRIANPLNGRYYSEYPTLANEENYVRIRYGDVGAETSEQIHLRQTLDATRTTRVITSDTQAPFKTRGFVLIGDGLFQIGPLTRELINPRALQKRYRTGMALTEVDNPLGLKV